MDFQYNFDQTDNRDAYRRSQIVLDRAGRELAQFFDTVRLDVRSAYRQLLEARQSYDRALSLHRTIGDRAGEAVTLHNLGQVQRSLGDYTMAQMLFEQALVLRQTIGDRRGEAHSLYHLGFLYGRLEEYDRGLSLLEEALGLLREMDELWGLGQALSYYGWVLEAQGQMRQARSHFEEALKVKRDLQQEAAMLEDVAHLGRVALKLRDVSLAEACLRHGLGHLEQQGTVGMEHVGQVYLSCYEILQRTGQAERAAEVLTQAWGYVASQAQLIEDPMLRHTFLHNVPEHRQIRELSQDSAETKKADQEPTHKVGT